MDVLKQASPHFRARGPEVRTDEDASVFQCENGSHGDVSML